MNCRLRDLKQHEKIVRETHYNELLAENKKLKTGLERVKEIIRNTTSERQNTEKTYQKLVKNLENTGLEI